jgi:hypothetical protein
MRSALRAFLGALAIGVSVAGAQMWFFDTPLTGAEEVPPSDSRATGRAMGTYNEATNVLRIMVNATGFESDIYSSGISMLDRAVPMAPWCSTL